LEIPKVFLESGLGVDILIFIEKVRIIRSFF